MPQFSQADISNIVDTQQNIAKLLDRVTTRLEALEKWRDTEDARRDRAETRREDQAEKAPDQLRANIALCFSCLMAALYLASFLSQHWH